MAEDDEFEEYNPHPYQGGYDIALTYGHPLSPSSAICYPISPPAPDALPPTPAPLPPAPKEPQLAQDGGGDGLAPSTEPAKPVPEPQGLGDDVPEPEQQQPQTYGYSDPWNDYRYNYPEPYLGFWPFSTPWDEPSEHEYWRQLRRAGDYLFGYSQGRGERIIGTDSYGIPVYANRKHGHEQPISVQLEPAWDHKVDYHEANSGEAYPFHSENWSSLPEKRRVEAGGYYERHYYEQPQSVQFDPTEPPWYEKPSYHELYQEQVYPQNEWSSSSSYGGRWDENHSVGNPIYAYERHSHEQPLSIQLEPFEPSWSQKLNFYNVSEEHSSPEFNWVDEKQFSENPAYDYERNYYEQPHSVQLEPYESTWSRTQGYYETYNEEVSPKSNREEDGHGQNTEDDDSGSC